MGEIWSQWISEPQTVGLGTDLQEDGSVFTWNLITRPHVDSPYVSVCKIKCFPVFLFPNQEWIQWGGTSPHEIWLALLQVSGITSPWTTSSVYISCWKVGSRKYMHNHCWGDIKQQQQNNKEMQKCQKERCKIIKPQWDHRCQWGTKWTQMWIKWTAERHKHTKEIHKMTVKWK